MATRTTYPAQIDTNSSIPRVTDNLTPITATVYNRLQEAIIAIEQELGVRPSGIYSTIKARLDVLENICDGNASPMSAMFFKSADGYAAYTTSEQIFFMAKEDVVIIDGYYCPEGSLTANDSNYASIVVNKRSGSGGLAVPIMTMTTKTSGSGDWTAFAILDLGTITDTELSAGQILTFEIQKTGSGVVVPAGCLVVHYRVP